MPPQASYLKSLLVLLVVLLTGCSEPPEISTIKAENRRLEVSFTERAETVLRQDYPVSMPVNGKIERIELEVGDRVREGQILVNIDVVPTRQEIEARQAGAEATRARQRVTADTTVEQAELTRARKQVDSVVARRSRLKPAIEAARTAVKNAKAENRRITNLVEGGALPSRDVEQAELALERAEAELSARLAESDILSAQLAEAQAGVNSVSARLQRKALEASAQSATISEAETRTAQARYTLGKATLASPIDGVVLARFERGPKELPAGSPLLSLGRMQDLEAVCDVLSQDALQLSPGTPVFLDAGAAYNEPLRGQVRLKEPQGFTKRSSLGVEQQRVKVRIEILDPPPDLGSGYELWARFQLSEKTAVSLPRSCFVRFGNEYRVWRVKGDVLELVAVEIGTRGNSFWEVKGSAIDEGDLIVKNPTDELSEGLEIKLRPEQQTEGD